MFNFTLEYTKSICVRLFFQGKALLSTHGPDVLSSPGQIDVSSISPCSHEEADTRLALHAYHMAQSGIKTITVRTADSDVFVIFVHIFHRLQALGVSEVWIAFGTSRYKLRFVFLTFCD